LIRVHAHAVSTLVGAVPVCDASREPNDTVEGSLLTHSCANEGLRRRDSGAHLLRPLDTAMASTSEWTCCTTELQHPVVCHRHDRFLISVVTGGSGQHQDEEGYLPTMAGDVWMLGPGIGHAYPRVNGALSLINLLVTRKYLEACIKLLAAGFAGDQRVSKFQDPLTTAANQTHHLHLAFVSLAQIERLFGALIAECERNEPNHAVAAGLILQIFGFLDRCPSCSSADGMLGDAPLFSAMQYLQDHYAEPVTSCELAGHCGYSPAYLATKFRRALGMPPSAYLLHVRLQRACALLRTTNRSVGSIALDVGFHDSRYFSTRFTQAMGMSPSTFRLRHGTEELGAPAEST
jgi:AraC-like DNA-binding protein